MPTEKIDFIGVKFANNQVWVRNRINCDREIEFKVDDLFGHASRKIVKHVQLEMRMVVQDFGQDKSKSTTCDGRVRPNSVRACELSVFAFDRLQNRMPLL